MGEIGGDGTMTKHTASQAATHAARTSGVHLSPRPCQERPPCAARSATPSTLGSASGSRPHLAHKRTCKIFRARPGVPRQGSGADLLEDEEEGAAEDGEELRGDVEVDVPRCEGLQVRDNILHPVQRPDLPPPATGDFRG